MATNSNDTSNSCGCEGWFWGRWSQAGLITAISIFALDQAHKWWMIAGLGMREGDRFNVLPFVDMFYKLNTGISYSLLDNTAYSWQLALAGFACLAAAVMWYWLSQASTSRLSAISLGLIIGGALGNALDRVLLGGVADFFLLHGFGYSWYVFNVADTAIVAGVIGLLYDLVVVSRKGAAKPM